MLKPRFLIGFTGHRAGFDETLIHSALRGALEDLQRRAAAVGGQADIYASVAGGSDTLCVEASRELGMSVHLLLPLPEAEFAKDFSSPKVWQRSKRQLELVGQKLGRDSLRVVPGEMTRPDCYFDQAIHMLEAVDVLIALWDGQPARGLGGTQQVIDHALRIGLPAVFIDSATGKTTTKGDLAKAFQNDEIMAELHEIACEAGDHCSKELGSADELQQCLDDIANAEAKRFRPSLVLIILLHGIAALLAAIVTFQLMDSSGTVVKNSVWENSKWVFAATELLVVSGALWMSFRLHRKHTQQRWIRCRFACELVRGLRASVPLVDPLHPLVGVHDPKWRRFGISVGLLAHESKPLSDPIALRNDYIAVRLSKTHPEGQIRHYEKMRPQALWWWDFTGQVSKWSAVLAPGFVLLSLANKLSKYWDHEHGGWHLNEDPRWWPFVVLLPIALPLFAGVASGIRQALDAGRRKERYPEMTTRLTALRTHLSGLETRPTIAHTVSQAEEILLDELREWQLTATTTGH
jgi:hypothetical protein